MCIIGITDYFRMDILNFRGPYTDPLESDIFTSTVGNINSFTAYVGMVMGFSGAMFITEDKVWRMVWHYICVVISFFAIIMGCSDNAYLSMGALFGLIPFVTFKDRECVKTARPSARSRSTAPCTIRAVKKPPNCPRRLGEASRITGEPSSPAASKMAFTCSAEIKYSAGTA